MKRLAIETAFETCSVALEVDGELRSRTRTEPRAHGRLLLPFIDELLAEAGLAYRDIDALVVDRGPGSFTSLRIGLGVAQGLALAHDLPVHPVSSLAMIASSGRDPAGPDTVLAAMDARMGEIYAGIVRFAGDRLGSLDQEVLCRPERIPLPDAPAQGVGTAFRVHAKTLPREATQRLESINAEPTPEAAALLRLAGEVDAVTGSELAPVYLRDRVTG